MSSTVGCFMEAFVGPSGRPPLFIFMYMSLGAAVVLDLCGSLAQTWASLWPHVHSVHW